MQFIPRMEGTVFTGSLEQMKHVKSEGGAMLTKPFLDICKHILPVVGMMLWGLLLCWKVVWNYGIKFYCFRLNSQLSRRNKSSNSIVYDARQVWSFYGTCKIWCWWQSIGMMNLLPFLFPPFRFPFYHLFQIKLFWFTIYFRRKTSATYGE